MNKPIYYKSLPLLLLLIILSVNGCKKQSEPDFMNEAVITGYDARMCVCCGGLMINFNNDSKPYSGTFYLIDHLPDNVKIDINSTFPVYMKVDWTFSSMCGGNKYINISRLEIEKK
jgi:hypothetical protein